MNYQVHTLAVLALKMGAYSPQNCQNFVLKNALFSCA